MTHVNRVRTSRAKAGSVFALGLVANLACGAETGNASSTTYENAGTLCFTQNGGRAGLSVYFQDVCLARGCEEFASSCDVKSVEGRLQVTTELLVTVSGENRVCPAACFFERAPCDLEDLTPGAYAVTLGSETAEVTLPVTSPISLFGDGGCPE